MEKNKKIVIGLCAMVAGGGHIALKNYLEEELKDDKRFVIIPFIHSARSYENINNILWPRIPTILDSFSKHLPSSFMGFSAVPLASECEKFIKTNNPDIVISTHTSMAGAFEVAKASLKAKFININIIPDYGEPPDLIIPTTRYVKPDYTFVLDDKAKPFLIKKLKYREENVFVTGYTASKTFRKMVSQYSSMTKNELILEVEKDLGRGYAGKIDPNKKTIIIAGGSGGIMYRSYGLLKYIVKHQQQNPNIENKFQILIITGTGKKFFNKLKRHHKKMDKGWGNIIPVPWLNREQYSKIQVLADFPILISIAPASMNELIEAGCGPIVIYSSRKAQENGNVKFTVENNLGYYIPKKKLLFEKIISGFSKNEIDLFIDESKKYKKLRMERIKNFPDQIANIYYAHVNKELKIGKKGFRPSLILKVASPNVWKSLAAMLIPVSILFGFVQYRKQRNKVGNSRAAKKIKKLISK